MAPPRHNNMASMVGSRSIRGTQPGRASREPTVDHKMSTFRKKKSASCSHDVFGDLLPNKCLRFCVYLPEKVIPNSPCMIFFTQKNKKLMATSDASMSHTHRELHPFLRL